MIDQVTIASEKASVEKEAANEEAVKTNALTWSRVLKIQFAHAGLKGQINENANTLTHFWEGKAQGPISTLPTNWPHKPRLLRKKQMGNYRRYVGGGMNN